MRRLWRWIVRTWTEPIRVEVTVTRSPDWEGDAAKYRAERGWD